MLKVEITCALGGFPVIPEGDYGDPNGKGIRIRKRPLFHKDPEAGKEQTILEVDASQFAEVEPSLAPEDEGRMILESTVRLVLAINRLVRWYRFSSNSPTPPEYSRGAIGTFSFLALPGRELWRKAQFVPELFRAAGSPAAIHAMILQGFASGDEPSPAGLFLLDARYALEQGRFREAVLTCWSVIDSVFNGAFDSIVKRKLAGEWPEAIRFLTGNDFGLRNKMTVGLRLVANHSFYGEPDELWQKLSDSYRTRNAIIHDGASASELEATSAVWVAQRIVKLMSEL